MKSKKFVLAALVLLAITGLLALTSCKNDSVSEAHTQVSEAHTHTFNETKWESDATGHWHPATCEHTEAKGGFASHTFDWKVQNQSTDTEAGKLVKKCMTCSWTDEMEIPAGFVYIPAGTFQMGSTAGYDDEKPVHGVTISKGYFMGRYEVTQQLYLEVMKEWGGTEPSSTYGEGGDYPAYYVSWYDAVVFCNELTKMVLDDGDCVYYSDEGLTTVYTTGDKGKTPYMDISKSGYRLPTEAEWEYAARAGDATTNARTWSGTKTETDLEEYAWYSKNGQGKTHEVGTKAANGLGLHDMSGNVWEWCWDWYGDYSTESVPNPTGPTGGSSGDGRVRRGGSWSISAGLCTVSSRNYSNPNNRDYILGFRLVRSAN